MGRCCGGKNAGKPITIPRYLAGLGVFCAYHVGVQALLRVAAGRLPHLEQVRDFQAKVFRDELQEVLRRDEIRVEGVLRPAEVETPCAIGVEAFPVQLPSGPPGDSAEPIAG
jgi:hypothetical protein